MKRFLGLLLVVWYSCALPTDPDATTLVGSEVISSLEYECSLSPEICEAWEAAQVLVMCIEDYPESLIHSKTAEQIKWVAQVPVPCGDTEGTVAGCYHASLHLIIYDPNTLDLAWTLRHEAGHALLHLLGDPNNGCFEHEYDKECPTKYWQFCDGLRLAP